MSDKTEEAVKRTNDHKRYLEKSGRKLATYEDAHIGQLVTPVYLGEGGYGGVKTVKWFNRSGVFCGEEPGFVEWGDVYLHPKGKVFTQIKSPWDKGAQKATGAIRQMIHEARCKIATSLMKKIYKP